MDKFSRNFQNLQVLGDEISQFLSKTACWLNGFSNVNVFMEKSPITDGIWEIHNIVLPESDLVHSICAKPTALAATVRITIEVA